jgi:hypothetical protein
MRVKPVDHLIRPQAASTVVLHCSDGEQIETRKQPQTVYNLTVTDYYTYFAGSSGLWVHAEKVIKVHGVSTSNRLPSQTPVGTANGEDIAEHFPVNKTGKSPHHYTVELPNPITQEIADLFDQPFGFQGEIMSEGSEGSHIVCFNTQGAGHDVDPASLTLTLLDYYDGAVSGMMECKQCGKTYAFEMLDWDRRHKVRIFSVAPLSVEDAQCFVQKSGQWEASPRPADFDLDAAYAELKRILDNASSIELIVAWHNHTDTVVAVREVAAGSQFHIQPWFEGGPGPQDWFEYLGISREDTATDQTV